MEISGKITFISEVATGEWQKGQWSKKDIEITENKTEYPNSILLTAFGKVIDKLDNINLNDNVTASFNSRVTEYQERRYNNLNLWSIKKESSVETKQEQKEVPDFPVEEQCDDLPF